MCKQIRHTYYCEELFLIKHKTKHSCESAIFYNLTADVVYSVCQFDYFYNTTVPPSILDGGSNILLANMLSPKRLICMKDSPMARPLPSHPYVLVTRSISCNCHLQTGLNYLLKSLSFCESGAFFTMYFTINSAFQHFMSEFGLSDSPNPDGRLLSQEHIFDIFLNDTSKPSIHPNTSMPILPLDPPDTLLELFQSISSRPHTSPNSPFFPIVWHTSMKIPNYPRKGSFLFSTAAHIVYFCTVCILTCMLAPQIYLACKHKKLQTLVTAMTLQRLPITEAMSAFEIPQNEEAKLICQDSWVSIAVTLITILGIAVYVYRVCNKITFFKGYLYDNTCPIYLFLSHECYHVPVKLRELNGLLHTFALSGQLKAINLQLLKHTLWDTLHIKWLRTTLNMNGNRIDLPENVNIPLWDKIKVRSIMAHKAVKFNIMIKQGNTWYAPKIEMANTKPQIQC